MLKVGAIDRRGGTFGIISVPGCLHKKQ
jgi:hypothetical protein